MGPWSLTRAIALDYRNKRTEKSVSPHCYVNPNAELKVILQTIDAGAAGRAVVNLNRFDPAMLKPFMPDTTQASGILAESGRVGTPPRGLPQEGLRFRS